MSEAPLDNADAPQSTRRVGVVIGSTRPNRNCEGITEWFLRFSGQEDAAPVFEVVDLGEIDLPFLDEPMMPALGNYQHEHTLRWSNLISSFDAFIFVFPQYNWGYPAVLKNALDFLYAEWRDKRAGLVTYGTRGGEKGAAQLKLVLQGLHMQLLEHHVELVISLENVDEQGLFQDIEGTLAPFVESAQQMVTELSLALN